MSRITKRFFALLLSMIMVLSIVPFSTLTASAAFGTTLESYNYPIRKISNSGRGIAKGHNAVDFTIKRGTPVYAAKSGTVYSIQSGCKNYSGLKTKKDCKKMGCSGSNKTTVKDYPGVYCNYGAGNGVTIKNDDGKYCTYSHMDTVNVKKGDKVTPKTILGTVGSTGCSTGAHLHFSVRKTARGTNYNPFNYIFPAFKVALSNNGSNSKNPTLKVDFAWKDFDSQYCKVFFGTSASSLTKTASNNNNEGKAGFSYELGKKFGELTIGKTYYIKIEIKKDGNISKSPIYSFVAGEGNRTFLDYGTNTSNSNLTVTLDGLSENSNTCVTVKSYFNTTANVQQVTYIYSTDASKIVGKNFAANTNNLGLGTQVEGETFAKKAWYGSENMKSLNTTIPNLKPNTTYYYCILVKANGKWWQSTTADKSKCGHFTTTNNKPETPVLAVSKGSADIGIGGTVNLSWNDCKYNSAYDIAITKDGSEVYIENNIQGTLISVPGEDVFTSTGTYSAVLTARNHAGSTVSDAVVITVHEDVTVTFHDLEEQVIYEKTVHYGESVDPPETPYKEGYDFIGWKNIDAEKETNLETVTENAELVANYKIKNYTVVFVNGETNEPIGESQTVPYMSAAAAPNLPTKEGYVYTWDTDFSCVKSDLTVQAISSWYNQNYPLAVSTEESTFVRDADGKGYDFSVKITRDPAKTKEAVTGRLVIALKTADGYMFGKTDSAAFNFGRNFTEESDSITVKGFVACENAIADIIEVFTVGSYEKAGALAAPVRITPDNTNQYTWKYVDSENDIPANAVESKPVTLYRYRQKINATSYATSLEGYVRDGYELKQSSTGTVDYVKTWQTYNKTGTTLYNKYNKTPVKASENDTTKTVVSENQIGYIYWHWCKSGTKTIASGDAGDKSSGFKTLHQFYVSGGKLPGDATYSKLANKKMSSVCSNSPYWQNGTDREHSPVAVYRQTYTVYNKLYHYYKWSEWSDWSAELPASGTNIETESKSGYQYKIESADVTVPAENSISHFVNDSNPLQTLDAAAFAGKQATVFIYKYTEPSDYTNEYVVSTTIREDGSLDLGEGYLREVPSAETGDFTIAASIEGQSDSIEIGTIVAPKTQLQVKFKYAMTDDDEHAIRIVNVEQGDSIAPPEESNIAIPEGMYLKGWSQSTANIQDNLIVTPVFMPKLCVVVFIDWGKQEFTLGEYQYEDTVTIPDYTDVEGKTVAWDLSAVENELNESRDSFTVRDHTVITTAYEVQENEAKFLLPITDDAKDLIDSIETMPDMIDESVQEGAPFLEKHITKNELLEMTVKDLNDLTDNAVQNEVTEFGDYTDVPDMMDDDEVYLFYGWKSVKTGEYFSDLTSKTSDVYYPVYDFGRMVHTPVANVETGEYADAQTVTLSCDTENAVIYYTLDGSDPRDADNANVMQYTAGETISITKSATLHTYATAMNYNDSDLNTYLYAIGGTYHVLTVYNDSNLMGDQAFVALIKDGGKLPSDAYAPIEGHTFAGVYLDSEYTEAFDYKSETITADLLGEESESTVIALYVRYIPDEYTVTFMDADGRVIKEVAVAYGAYTEEPDASELQKEGYVFVGWDNDDYAYVTDNAVCTARYVPEDEYVRVSFKRSKYSITANSSKQLNPVLTPDNATGVSLSWTTDNADVAQVDYNGVVTGIAPGTAVITATVDATGESASVTFAISADSETTIVLSPSGYLKTDADGDIRRVDESKNTVDEIKDQFVTEELKFFDASGNELVGTDRVGTGTVVLLMNGEEVMDRKVFVMTGDADGDGEITNHDSAFIARLLVGKEESNPYIQKSLDLNGDGDVNVRDASMLAQYLVGKATITA